MDEILEQIAVLSRQLDLKIAQLMRQVHLLEVQKENLRSFAEEWPSPDVRHFENESGTPFEAIPTGQYRIRHRKRAGGYLADLQARNEISHNSGHGNVLYPNSKKEDVAAAARQVLLERGKPVSKAEMFDTLQSRGITITGLDPEKAMNTMLWRTRDNPEHAIIHVRGAGYWLREVPYESAGYYGPNDILGMEDDAPPADDY